MSKPVKYTILLLLTVIILFSLSCTQKPEYNRIDFSNREPARITSLVESPETVFRVAVAGVVSPIETIKSYSQMISYLGKALRQNAEIVQRRTYAEINDLVKLRSVDLAFVCTLAYVQGDEDFGMELLVVPEVRGQVVYHSYIIVAANSSIENLKDLQGKTFAFTDPLSNSGRLAPTYLLYQIGETPDSFFEKYTFTFSHDNSIRAVAEGIVDGAAVDSLVYDYIIAQEPTIRAKTKIIHVSQPFGIPPVVVHPALDKEVKARLRSLLMNINQDETGKEILNDLMIDRFVLGNDASYNSVRHMARELGW